MVERILNLMRQHDVSAKKLTSDLEISHSSISEWKKGKANPSAQAIVKLASYFNVTTDYILTGENPENSSLAEKENNEGIQNLDRLDLMLIGMFNQLDSDSQREVFTFINQRLQNEVFKTSPLKED